MYFVVYLPSLKRNVVLPASWILNVEDHYEKFINLSINRSQWFLCYYTNNDAAFVDGKPDEKFEVNFKLPMIQIANTADPFNGCFLGKLKHFNMNYIDADAFLNRQRHIEPAVYNKRRMKELPIPSLDTQNNSNVSCETYWSGGESEVDDTNNTQPVYNENEVTADSQEALWSEESIVNNTQASENDNDDAAERSGNDESFTNIEQSKTVHEIEQLTASYGNASGNTVNEENYEVPIDANTIDPLIDNTNSVDPLASSNDSETKTDLVHLHHAHCANNSDIEKLLDEPEEIVYDDDITMVIGAEGFPKPWQLTSKDMVKRNDDPMSGNIPFNLSGKGRVYRIGKQSMEIPQKVVQKIIEWNAFPKRDNVDFDRKICNSLILSLVPKQKLCSSSNISDEVLSFVKACFAVRCEERNLNERIASIGSYINELCSSERNTKIPK